MTHATLIAPLGQPATLPGSSLRIIVKSIANRVARQQEGEPFRSMVTASVVFYEGDEERERTHLVAGLPHAIVAKIVTLVGDTVDGVELLVRDAAP